MRIIAGQRRGHKIEGPRHDHTRPTSDMVRESIFNILGDAVDDRPVYDLFAGTGALGLEALSRGGSHLVAVETQRDNVALIRRNAVTLRYEDRVTVLPTDVNRWAKTWTPAESSPVLILLDPPYREYENHPKRFRALLQALIEKAPADSILVVEASQRQLEDVLPDYDAWDVRRYGGTRLAVRTTTPRLEHSPALAAQRAMAPDLDVT